jgi:hypothetical protein
MAAAASPKLLDCVVSPAASARPHRRQLDAVGRDNRPVPRAVAGWRLANDLPEHAAECPQAGKADVHADVGDAAVSLTQEKHGAFHAPPLKVPMRRLAEDGAEAPDEVSFRDMGDRSHGADIERLGVGTVHGIAGAQQATVEILGFPTHPQTLRDREARVPTAANDAPTP